MGETEAQAEAARQERGKYVQTWRVINERRRLYARKRANKAGRGRRKHRKLRAENDRLEERFTAAVAGLRSAVQALNLLAIGDGDTDEFAVAEERARNALKFAEDQERVDSD